MWVLNKEMRNKGDSDMTDFTKRITLLVLFAWAYGSFAKLFAYFMFNRTMTAIKTHNCKKHSKRKELFSSVVVPYVEENNPTLNLDDIEYYQSVYECLRQEMEQRKNSEYGLETEFEYEITRMNSQCHTEDSILTFMSIVLGTISFVKDSGIIACDTEANIFLTITVYVVFAVLVLLLLFHGRDETNDRKRELCAQILARLKSEMLAEDQHKE